MKYSDRQFYGAKYSANCVVVASIFLILSNGSQASELNKSSRKQPHISISHTQPLFIPAIANQKIPRQTEEKKTLIISQQPHQQNGNTPINSNKSLAQQLEESPSSAQAHPHRFYIGPDLFYRDYKEEEITPGFKSNEFGTLYGVQATYDYVKGNSIYGGGSLRYGGGTTTYDGAVQNPSRPFTSTTNNQFLNAEGRLGYTFNLDKQERFLISPFVGVGYHHWDRDVRSGFVSGDPQQPVANLIENYSWGYVGPGVQAKYQISSQFDIGLNAKLMMMVDGKIGITTKSPSTGQVTSTDGGSLGNALQYEVELPINYHLVRDTNSNIDLKLTPYYRSQDIARGPLFRSGAREPASKTSVYGVTLGAQFDF